MDPVAVVADEYDLIAEASQALQYGLHDAAHKIVRILQTGVWRSFTTPNGRHVTHERFEEFVVAKGLDGLNTDITTVRNVCRNNRRALDLLDEALKRPVGRPKGLVDDVGPEPDEDKELQETFDNIQGLTAPTGTSTDRALRRLRKERPDLHARVLADELSPHAAMVEAGFRHRTATFPIDDINILAKALTRRLTPCELLELRELLADD